MASNEKFFLGGDETIQSRKRELKILWVSFADDKAGESLRLRISPWGFAGFWTFHRVQFNFLPKLSPVKRKIPFTVQSRGTERASEEQTRSSQTNQGQADNSQEKQRSLPKIK